MGTIPPLENVIDYGDLDEADAKERQEKSRYCQAQLRLHKRRLQLYDVPNEALEDLFRDKINAGWFLREILDTLKLNSEGTLVQRKNLK